MMRRISVILAILFCATAARGGEPTTQPNAYPIRLSRPSHVGDTWTLSVKAKRTASTTWTQGGDGRPPAVEQLEAALEGTETVNAVSPKGRVTRSTFIVTRCTKDAVQVLPPGTTITAENANDATVFQVNGAAPAADVRAVLRHLIYASRPDEPTADDRFGTDRPRRVGDSWPAHADQLAKATRLPYRVTAQDFTGTATLAGVSAQDGHATQTVRTVEHCAFDSRPKADGSTVNKLTMDREITFVTPTTADTLACQSTDRFVIAFDAVDPAGTRRVQAQETTERSYADVRH